MEPDKQPYPVLTRFSVDDLVNTEVVSMHRAVVVCE